jgi:hypothetical protein
LATARFLAILYVAVKQRWPIPQMASDFVKAVHARKAYKHNFCLSPPAWRAFKNKTPLTWARVKFTPGNRKHIPTTRGIYAFVVLHDNPSFPPHGFVMYIGESGNKNKRTLHVRYQDYLTETIVRKRHGVHYMLRNWRGSLFFFYSPVADKRYNLRKLERDLNDALFPPFSSNDFSLEVRGIKRAF